MKRKRTSLALLLCLVVAASTRADVPTEAPGHVERLGLPFHAHWVWVSDILLERIALVDLDSGRFLGMINGGYGTIAPLFSRERKELYLPATYFARRTRGERTDVLEVHDIATLSPLAEVRLPPMRAIDAVALGHAALSDDERFAAVFNWTPRTSLSIVDVEQRTFTAEIDIPGCSLIYAAGRRRFFSLCADGSALLVTIDDTGHEVGKQRTVPFFDPTKDPVTEKAVRVGDQWVFVSFEGYAYPINVSDAALQFGEQWSLLSDEDRKASWRVGGHQHLAAHAPSGRLYSLVHRGEKDTHKEAGSEVWVYDIANRRRLQRIELRSPGFTVYGFPIEFGRAWPWPFNGLSDWLLDTFVPAEVSHIQVTPDEQPLLFTASQFSGGLGVYDALTGRFVRRVIPVGWTTDLLLAPWSGE
jgi:methylamine dehydrogenase heavy chain